MRYNHRYHQASHGTVRHRQIKLTSFVILTAAIVFLSFLAPAQFNGRHFLADFSLSLWRVTIAYFVSLGLAMAMGLLAASSPAAEAALLPVLDVAQSFPSFALLPILVVNFGHGGTSVIVILVIAMIWPILFSVIGGIKEQRGDQAEAAHIFGARGWKFLRYYRLPMLRPSLVTGSIVSWGEAWDVLVGAEIIAQVAGAGRTLGDLSQSAQLRVLLLGVAVYLLLIFGLNQLIWLPLLQRVSKYQAES